MDTHDSPHGHIAVELGIVETIRHAAGTDPMRVQQLRGAVHVVMGSGGNVVALPGPDGVVLVDSGIVGPRVTAVVATISEVPIQHVINTHWHFDLGPLYRRRRAGRR